MESRNLQFRVESNIVIFVEKKALKPIAQGFKDLLLGPQVRVSRQTLRGYVDSLIQTFENFRSGISNEMLARREPSVEDFFVDLYNKELPRLKKAIETNETYLSEDARKDFVNEVCAVLRRMVIPAYVRLAVAFTPRERNDFFLLPEKLHLPERIAWAVAGMILGVFVVWAPFIPIWSKEWVLPFCVAGLIVPDLRKFVSVKRYEGELNRMVAKADLEIDRIEMEYLTAEKLSVATPGTVADDADLQAGNQQKSLQQKSDRSIIK